MEKKLPAIIGLPGMNGRSKVGFRGIYRTSGAMNRVGKSFVLAGGSGEISSFWPNSPPGSFFTGMPSSGYRDPRAGNRGFRQRKYEPVS
jgi:hypothetical protein